MSEKAWAEAMLIFAIVNLVVGFWYGWHNDFARGAYALVLSLILETSAYRHARRAGLEP